MATPFDSSCAKLNDLHFIYRRLHIERRVLHFLQLFVLIVLEQ